MQNVRIITTRYVKSYITFDIPNRLRTGGAKFRIPSRERSFFFPKLSRLAVGSKKTLNQWISGLVSTVRKLRGEGNHSPPTCVDTKSQ